MVDDGLRQSPIRPGTLSLPFGGGSRSSRATASSGGGDSLWNGILIGAALGVAAIFTTAAEAPPSGKVATVVMTAALGGYVDSRLAVTSPIGPGRERRGRRLLFVKAVRF
jgi:hypothetical protein